MPDLMAYWWPLVFVDLFSNRCLTQLSSKCSWVILYISIISVRILLYWSVVKFNALSLSCYSNLLISRTYLVALLWIFSISVISLKKRPPHIQDVVMPNSHKVGLFRFTIVLLIVPIIWLALLTLSIIWFEKWRFSSTMIPRSVISDLIYRYLLFIL